MQRDLLNMLLCPVDKNKLQLEVYKTEKREYKKGTEKITAEEIIEGLLISGSGLIYPIVNGVPRIHINAFLDYEDFISKHYTGYSQAKQIILNKYGYIINDVVKKTKKTKKSFSQEWKIFKYDGGKTWGFTKDVRKRDFLRR